MYIPKPYSCRMVDLLQDVMQHNFYPAIIVVSAVGLVFHYNTMAESSYGCPMVIAEGDPETGKMLTLIAALSACG